MESDVIRSVTWRVERAQWDSVNAGQLIIVAEAMIGLGQGREQLIQECIIKRVGLQPGRVTVDLERSASQPNKLGGSQDVIEMSMRRKDETNRPADRAGAAHQEGSIVDRVDDQRLSQLAGLPTT